MFSIETDFPFSESANTITGVIVSLPSFLIASTSTVTNGAPAFTLSPTLCLWAKILAFNSGSIWTVSNPIWIKSSNPSWVFRPIACPSTNVISPLTGLTN